MSRNFSMILIAGLLALGPQAFSRPQKTLRMPAASNDPQYIKTYTDTKGDYDALPVALVRSLLDAGLSFEKKTNEIFVISVKNIRCDGHNSGAASSDSGDPHFLVGDEICYRDSQPGFDVTPTVGTKLAASLELSNMLMNTIDSGGLGKQNHSYGFAKSIVCTINTKIDTTGSGKRISCVVDSNEQ